VCYLGVGDDGDPECLGWPGNGQHAPEEGEQWEGQGQQAGGQHVVQHHQEVAQRLCSVTQCMTISYTVNSFHGHEILWFENI